MYGKEILQQIAWEARSADYFGLKCSENELISTYLSSFKDTAKKREKVLFFLGVWRNSKLFINFLFEYALRIRIMSTTIP